MVNALILIVALILAIITFMTLAYAISSIWEKERRAAILGGVGFLILLGMEIGIFYLKARNAPVAAPPDPSPWMTFERSMAAFDGS